MGSLGPFMCHYHFLGHLVGGLLLQVKGKLYGSIVFGLALQLLGVFHPKPQGYGRFPAVVLLCEFHPDARVFRKEGMAQQVLNLIPGGRVAPRQGSRDKGAPHPSTCTISGHHPTYCAGYPRKFSHFISGWQTLPPRVGQRCAH